MKVDLTKYQFLRGVGASAEPLGPRGMSLRRPRPLGRTTTGTLRRLREELYGRPQQNGDLLNKASTLRGVFEGRSHEVSIFTRCGGTPILGAGRHLGPSLGAFVALLHALCVIVMYTIPLPCGT